MSALPELDPFVEDFQQFPFATLALLRERAPVHAMAEPGWYIVTTIDLAREVLTNPARFSNQVCMSSAICDGVPFSVR